MGAVARARKSSCLTRHAAADSPECLAKLPARVLTGRMQTGATVRNGPREAKVPVAMAAAGAAAAAFSHFPFPIFNLSDSSRDIPYTRGGHHWRLAMWKSVVAGAAALAIAGTSLVYAQQRDHGPGFDRRAQAHRGLSQEDRAAFTDARIAALKAGLRLTPEQEKNWPAFETALRDMAKMRQERMSSRRQDEPRAADPIERLRRQADAMTKAGENLKRLADAQEPLYQSLDDSQKNRFNLLSRVLTGHRAHFAQMREHRRMMRRMHERHQGNGDRMHHRMGPSMQEGTTGEQL